MLDGQTNQALACVRSLGRAGYRVLVASQRRWPLAAWSRYSRGGYRLSGQTVAAFAQLRVAYERAPAIIAKYASGDGDLSPLQDDPRWQELFG